MGGCSLPAIFALDHERCLPAQCQPNSVVYINRCSSGFVDLSVPWHVGWMEQDAALCIYVFCPRATFTLVMCGCDLDMARAIVMPSTPFLAFVVPAKSTSVSLLNVTASGFDLAKMWTRWHTPKGNERFLSAIKKRSLLLPAALALVVVSCRNRCGFMSKPTRTIRAHAGVSGIYRRQNKPNGVATNERLAAEDAARCPTKFPCLLPPPLSLLVMCDSETP